MKMHLSRSFCFVSLTMMGYRSRCFPHIDMVSREVDSSDFQQTKSWLLSYGIEVQGHLNTLEEAQNSEKFTPPPPPPPPGTFWPLWLICQK